MHMRGFASLHGYFELFVIMSLIIIENGKHMYIHSTDGSQTSTQLMRTVESTYMPQTSRTTVSVSSDERHTRRASGSPRRASECVVGLTCPKTHTSTKGHLLSRLVNFRQKCSHVVEVLCCAFLLASRSRPILLVISHSKPKRIWFLS